MTTRRKTTTLAPPPDISVVVPPGIGDIWWCHRRLVGLYERISYRVAALDSHVVYDRALPFVRTWPHVHSITPYRVTRTEFHALGNTFFRLDPSGRSLIQNGMDWRPSEHYSCNAQLDCGTRIEDIDPHRVVWDIPLPVKPVAWTHERFLLVYVGAAAQSGRWPLWTPSGWADAVRRLLFAYGWDEHTVVLVGAEYDRSCLEEVRAGLGAKETELLIDLEPAALCWLMTRACFFLSYQSGLSILAEHLGVPGLMLYFPSEQLAGLPEAWPRPENIGRCYHWARMDTRPSVVIDKLAWTP